MKKNCGCIGILCTTCLAWSSLASAEHEDFERALRAANSVKKPTHAQKVSDIGHLNAARNVDQITPKATVHRPARPGPTVLRWDPRAYSIVDTTLTSSTIIPSATGDAHTQATDPLAWKASRSIEFAVRSNSNAATHGQSGEPDGTLVTTRTDVGVLGSVNWKF
jgi:hypothetical protein